MSSVLTGCRVLVVEDELMVAQLIEDVLRDEGCTVVGPYSRLDEALIAVKDMTPDLALLDINLAGVMVFPLADVLEGQAVPFLLLSGYDSKILPKDRRHWPLVNKPFRIPDLVLALHRLIGVE